MSKDFDKEAEREKLKEKYEQDKQKRQATEQMSELLLQGATMTNAHCSECGDPVFRYDGQEFCPTCEKPVDRGEHEEGKVDDEDADSENIQVTTPSDDARVAFGEDRQARAQNDEQANTGNAQQPSQPAAPSPTSPDRQMPTGEGSVTAARESLVQTLTRFSQQAAATDDPNRAQDHLAAAREAAEALAALRQ